MAKLTSSGIVFASSPTVDQITTRTWIFPKDSAWIFYQTAAPTGWTKSITHNNKALRVVSGDGGGSGGTNSFSTVMSSFNIGGTLNSSNATGGFSLTTTEIASHDHASNGVALSAVPALSNPDGSFAGWNGGDVARNTGWTRSTPATAVNPNGSGNSHSHPVSASGTLSNQPVSIAVQYLDVLVCTFNG